MVIDVSVGFMVAVVTRVMDVSVVTFVSMVTIVNWFLWLLKCIRIHYENKTNKCM